FDEAFEAYFVGDADARLPRVFPLPSEAEIRQMAPDGALGGLRLEEGSTAASWRPAGEDEEPEGESALRIVASDAEVLRTKSVADLTDEERIRTDRLIRELAVRVPRRRARRLRPAPKGPTLDLRRTLRRSL